MNTVSVNLNLFECLIELFYVFLLMYVTLLPAAREKQQ